MSAIYYLSVARVPLYFIDGNGRMYSSLLPTQARYTGQIHVGQYEAYLDEKRREYFANQIVDAKLKTQEKFLVCGARRARKVVR